MGGKKRKRNKHVWEYVAERKVGSKMYHVYQCTKCGRERLEPVTD